MANKALVFKEIPQGYPVPGQHLTVEPATYDANVAAPADGVVLQSLYTSFDPYMRGRMRPAEVKSYAPAFDLNKPIESASIAKVIRSNTDSYKEGDLVIGHVAIQEYVSLDGPNLARIRKLENPLGIEDIRVFLGALGMPGLTAYSSLYAIGKPKKGETIFVSAASGAVGQIVGQLAKHEGLRVIGSVGSDEKLDFIIKELGFDGGFNYKNEKPADALARLAPEGIDIYYENVGGEHLEAALDAMKNFGRVVVCGLISQYNSAPYPIKNIHNVLVKRITMRGFIVGDPDMGPIYTKEHQERVQKWIKEGSFKVLIHETEGIDNAAEGLVGIFYGKNKGKAVLKF
ncbi:NADP-dependent oxidoreductase RED1 [Penicillium subrubescens]|jgi:NADPH-dependent curcumin reductase CurA|uniref:Zinc-type alcohol dehydrogenase-like protein PB24D3.08c n=1 Tax=Penicillium subrubescens TaxID=1316194 RepID=A0A1Q5UDA9_9EURO|nr:NADP-dependent oxidoreductase RED1 [Penicillium subrubescens]KAJ5883381.1 NADP-dependent oxidoreductase RED1 [Penicillium subrubescens]OKP10441.1 Zinc-type alcohol dehydrogenase-like protein PB24D3.08c [Penicillium subrubescens]